MSQIFCLYGNFWLANVSIRDFCFQSVVNDLAPLLLSTKPQILQRFPSHMIEAARQPAMREEEPSLGAGLYSNPLSVDDRRALYDFVVEVLKNTIQKYFAQIFL